MTEEAARTVRNDLDEVRNMGIELVKENLRKIFLEK